MHGVPVVVTGTQEMHYYCYKVQREGMKGLKKQQQTPEEEEEGGGTRRGGGVGGRTFACHEGGLFWAMLNKEGVC